MNLKNLKMKILVSYCIINGVSGIFDSINITPKPDMTISDIFDLVRRKYKNDKNITKIELLDLDKLKEEL